MGLGVDESFMAKEEAMKIGELERFMATGGSGGDYKRVVIRTEAIEHNHR